MLDSNSCFFDLLMGMVTNLTIRYGFSTFWEKCGIVFITFYYSGNLYSRVGQSSCSCFVSVIFLIFSFHLSLAPCIKTHTKTQEMALRDSIFQNFPGEHAPGPP